MMSIQASAAHQTSPETARAKPATLVWDNPFLRDAILSEEERMIRDTAHAYCQEKLKPRAIKGNRNEVFDREIMNEMGELGLLDTTIPEHYGCVGANYVA